MYSYMYLIVSYRFISLLADPDSSVSHMLILPPHPSVLSEMTPTDGGMSFDDFMNVEPEMEGADPLIAVIGDDLFAVKESQ